MSPKPLNERQKAFCLEYLIDPNATQAAIRAGYSKNTAHVQGFDLLKNPKIKERLQAVRKELQNKTNISNAKIINEYIRVAFARLTDFVSLKGNTITVKSFDELSDDQKAAICEITQKGEYFKVKLHDKLRALDSLSKIFGLFDGAGESATEEYIRNRAIEAGLDPDKIVARVFDFEAEWQKRRRRR